MLLINKPDFQVSSDRRLVKASDVAAVRSAAEVVAAAEAEAAKICEDAKAAYEEERKRGYEKGLADGNMEIAMKKLDMVDSSVRFMESVEGRMADVVMKALRSCVAEIGDREMVVQIVRKTLAAVIRAQKQATIRVAPEMLDVVKEKPDGLRRDYPTLDFLEAVADERLSGPACVLETEAGVADASVETQLAAIERSLARHVSGFGDKG